MGLHLGKSDERKKKVVGLLRRAQLVTTFGSGALVDMPEYSVIIAATDYWRSGSSTILHEPNLEKLLKVSHFKLPYVSPDSEKDYTPDIPAFRFPIMHFCPECGKLMPYWGFVDDNICGKCKKKIVPSRFIVACINGHLEDFPYRWWVHYGDYTECPLDSHDDKLEIHFSSETGGLESIRIKCTKCGKTRTMAGSMQKDALHGYHCCGRRPWLGLTKEHNETRECRAPLRGLMRGASNVYFSQTASALTIPPWSNSLHQTIEKRLDSLKPIFENPSAKEMRKTMIEALFADVLSKGGCSSEQLVDEIARRINGGQTGEYTKRDLYEDEFRVFIRRDYEQSDDFQFRIEGVETPEFLADYIEDVVMAKRLREVLALKGFRRISPEKTDGGNERFPGYNLSGDCVPLSSAPLNWYPAIEMLGEGIFIRIREDVLSEWEEKNREFYRPMKQRLTESCLECDNFSPRYVLLHTLAHLLIRQLAVECGYSGASIKERIYSTYPGSEQKMAGVLLYTSSSDSDGSLGGLARNALPKSFERIFRNLLQEASWCSSDPVCIESRSQGYDSLNYAACHACTLLPETCCEMRNCLLDRGAVVGSVLDRSRGFFGDLLMND